MKNVTGPDSFSASQHDSTFVAPFVELRLLPFMGLIGLLLVLAGCAGDASKYASTTVSESVSGILHGGQQPVGDSSIQLYAISSSGNGSASQALLSQPVMTNQNGEFTLPPGYTCPSANSIVYLTARGGNPGLAAGTNNASIGAMAVLGTCGSIGPSTFVHMNELTTIGSIWPLASFANGYASIGYGNASATQFNSAVTEISQLTNVASGTTPGAALPGGATLAIARLNTLASILANCINSVGGSAGDGSVCGYLFQYATLSGTSAPTNTLDAMFAIAANPTVNVANLFYLTPPVAAFQPTLPAAPADWTLPIVTAPIFSPASGSYTSSVTASLATDTTGAVIHYTTDGTTPTASSATYSAPITLSQSATVNALSLADNMTSSVVSANYSVARPVSLALTVTPATVSLQPSQTQTFKATVANSSNTAVSWSISPALGTITSAGVYTAPASIAASRTVTVTATSSAAPTVYANATISLIPPVTVSVTPGSLSLTPSQIEAFTATVANSSNTAVSWSLNPALGSISATGVYIAPASIASAETVTVTATSAANPAVSASAVVTLNPAGATYYLSPSGNDSNNGKSSSASWLTPNHSLNCGDVILAAASTSYAAANFASGKWGTVTCAAANNVAWLKCATFDACKISVTSGTLDGMRVSASYWGVQGWEVSNTSGGALGGNCFVAAPPTTSANIHHIIFANDIANVCPLDGLSSGNVGTAGVDYFVVVGSLAYGAGQTSKWCGSGISVYEPAASDTQSGTHIYVAGNFSYLTTNPTGCYDGNGIIFDTFDGSQTPMLHTYTQQGVIDNNISLSNGGVGVRMEYNDAGTGSSHATLYARHNTTWGNSNGTYQYGNPTCGEVQLYKTVNTQAFLNIAVTNQQGCYGANWIPLFAYAAADVDSTSSIYDNVAWSAYGSYSIAASAIGFLFGPGDLFGTNPGFAHPVAPVAPNCARATSVPNCMATVIANFTPTASAAAAYGYQIPSSTPTQDALFPKWLCNVNLPAGLVTMGCLAN